MIVLLIISAVIIGLIVYCAKIIGQMLTSIEDNNSYLQQILDNIIDINDTNKPVEVKIEPKIEEKDKSYLLSIFNKLTNKYKFLDKYGAEYQTLDNALENVINKDEIVSCYNNIKTKDYELIKIIDVTQHDNIEYLSEEEVKKLLSI